MLIIVSPMRAENFLCSKQFRSKPSGRLSSIYMVSVSGKKLVSKISKEQETLLERLGLKLEAN